MNNSPSFFEHLVVELLLKMGYGYGKQAGVVTGRPHDGGIDAVIYEDNLGLDMIYIQAKRYASKHKVKKQEVAEFAGDMKHIQKGVFITTSKFTKDAWEYPDNQQPKHIKLIDGDTLADLILKYEVGLIPVQTFSLYKIDSDYYNVN